MLKIVIIIVLLYTGIAPCIENIKLREELRIIRSIVEMPLHTTKHKPRVNHKKTKLTKTTTTKNRQGY